MEGYIAGPKYKGTTGPHNLLKTMNKRLAEVEAEAGNVAKPFNPLTEIYGGHA